MTEEQDIERQAAELKRKRWKETELKVADALVEVDKMAAEVGGKLSYVEQRVNGAQVFAAIKMVPR